MKTAQVDARPLLQENRVDAILVTKRENIRYLSGFTGSFGVLLITSSAGHFISDSRYAEQSEREVSGFRIGILKKGEQLLECVGRLLKKRKVGRVGFEPMDLRVQQYNELKKKASPVRLVPLKNGIESLRLVKSGKEQQKILMAVRRAEKAFTAVRRKICPGVSEREVALIMEGKMRCVGAAQVAFDTIVASGKRSAMPHGVASNKKLKRGDLVIVDFGAECDGYFSDMTRTLYLGKRFAGEKRKIYDVVLEAQEAAIGMVKPGVNFEDIDAAARNVIHKAGFGAYFGHGTGHGIGMEVHEPPRVSPNNQERTCRGMIFTIEPGIYVPGLGGVRIEDMVLVTARGCNVLTTLSRDWQN
jgi:Xaa-Pro aminopeptidase